MAPSLQTAGIRPASARLVRAFGVIARMHLRRHFRAVRLTNAHRAPPPDQPHLIFYFNHASWWDPLVHLLLAQTLLPGRLHYAPMEAAALHQYNFFRRLGAFPIQVNTPRGAAQFLRGSEAVLASGGVLWVSPQGAFADVRQRPPVLKPGLGALLARLPHAVVVPVAVEYLFWDQRLPEVLLNLGEAVVHPGADAGAAAWTARLEAALATTQDELLPLAMARNPAPFTALLEGGRGTAGVYGAWQRLRSTLRGERFQADHQAHADLRDRTSPHLPPERETAADLPQ